MKIVFITSWYSERMGYSENFLPKAMAALGEEVHVISSTAQVYFNSPDYKKTYEPFIGPNIVAAGTKSIDGYTLHRLPLRKHWMKNVIRMEGLAELLQQLSPDIIQVFDINSVLSYDAAVIAQKMKVKFFTESHVHASVFDTADRKTKLKYRLLGLPRKLDFINAVSQKHYPIAADVAKLSAGYFKVPAGKIGIQSLGVDTGLFTPVLSPQQENKRQEIREQSGFGKEDIVCIYTGRFTKDKNPQCLAQAVDFLQENGYPLIRALFVGSGTTEDIQAIRFMKGCVVHPFVKVTELPPFYHAADIGVWPKQESTSQLDAMACGLPIIVSNKVEVMERVTGNGLLYEENNYQDLADKIKVLTDAALRKRMAAVAVGKVRDHFSWDAIAKERIMDYQASVS